MKSQQMLKKLLSGILAITFVIVCSPHAHAASTISGNSLTIDNAGGSATQVGIDLQPAVTASGANAYGTRLQQTLTASANSDALTGLYINPTFTDSSFTGVKHNGLIVANGNVGIGTSAPGYTLTVPKDVRFGNDAAAQFAFVEQKLAIGAATKPTTANIGGDIVGIIGQSTINNAQTGGPTSFGVKGISFLEAGAAINASVGVAAQTFSLASVTDAKAAQASMIAVGAGVVITNQYGFFVGNLTNAGSTITNTYGVFVGDVSSGTQTNFPYSIYSSDANSYNYFAGNVGIGATTPSAKLDVKDGHIASTQTTLPTPSVTGSGYSGASMGVGSSDTKGGITATVGAAAGTLIITFNSAYTSAPYCAVTPATATAQVDVIKMYATATTGALTLNFAASPTGGSETFNYICVQ